MRGSNRLSAAASHHWATTSFWCLSGPFRAVLSHPCRSPPCTHLPAFAGTNLLHYSVEEFCAGGIGGARHSCERVRAALAALTPRALFRGPLGSSGGGIRTRDLRVMRSPAASRSATNLAVAQQPTNDMWSTAVRPASRRRQPNRNTKGPSFEGPWLVAGARSVLATTARVSARPVVNPNRIRAPDLTGTRHRGWPRQQCCFAWKAAVRAPARTTRAGWIGGAERLFGQCLSGYALREGSEGSIASQGEAPAIWSGSKWASVTVVTLHGPGGTPEDRK
jgi:hypothetical protein